MYNVYYGGAIEFNCTTEERYIEFIKECIDSGDLLEEFSVTKEIPISIKEHFNV